MYCYQKKGDWQDTIKSKNQDVAVMKYRPATFPGKIMLHCHILPHEDLGNSRIPFFNYFVHHHYHHPPPLISNSCFFPSLSSVYRYDVSRTSRI